MPDTPKDNDLNHTKRIMERLVNTPPKPHGTENPLAAVGYVDIGADGKRTISRIVPKGFSASAG